MPGDCTLRLSAEGGCRARRGIDMDWGGVGGVYDSRCGVGGMIEVGTVRVAVGMGTLEARAACLAVM